MISEKYLYIAILRITNWMLVRKGDDKQWENIIEALANESRRRILQLLTKKPCYVSEISYALKMAPKVVLEHLDRLEKTGLIKSFEDGRRRYYYIDRSLNISISISPHRFDVDVIEEKIRDLEKEFTRIKSLLERSADKSLMDAFERLRKMEKMFCMVQKSIAEGIDELIDRFILRLDRLDISNIDRVVLYAMIKGVERPDMISQMFGLPYDEVLSSLMNLEKRGFVERVGSGNGMVFRIRKGGGVYE